MATVMAACGCRCVCHEDELKAEWPGPCAACCEPGDDCECGRALMMKPYFADEHLTVYLGDCRVILAELPAASVHCVVTSPPYWGLRDYGTASWEGGDADCAHLARALVSGKSGLRNDGRDHLGPYEGEKAVTTGMPFRATCGKCGARRVDSQLGLEATPDAYVAAMVGVFREVRRVLRDDGTLWLNLGDSYVSNGWWPDAPSSQNGSISRSQKRRDGGGRGITHVAGLKPKDLVGIPWRVAFALQADGWYLRSDIIWSKPNPMPESVTDRPTKAHEYIFLLSKSPRYYYDADAVREPAEYGRREWSSIVGNLAGVGLNGERGHATVSGSDPSAGRNLRSVWSIATQPYPGAHFATFPEALVEPCVKAGTSERGVCPECGAPWLRETSVSHTDAPGGSKRHSDAHVKGMDEFKVHTNDRALKNVETTGWRASCGCHFHHDGLEPEAKRPYEPVPAVVLDPFAGSGTVGLVANRLGRRAILIDLSADYLGQVMARNAQKPLGLVG